jgi:hypothetical protein
MANLPSGYVVSTTGNYGNVNQKVGGVSIGLSSATSTSAGNPITRAFSVKDQAIVRGRNRPIKRTAAGGTYNATHTLSSTETFAYDQTVSDWTVMRMGTTLNGTSSTVLRYSASGPYMARRNIRLKSIGANTSTAFRAGYLRYAGVSQQRNPWSTQPGSGVNNFVSTTSNSTVADDQAIFVTYMSVPGELVYMNGAINPVTDEYAARDGN